MAGTLIKEKVRCGRPNCYCSKREKVHEANYLYWRDYPNGGKLRKRYVPKKDVVRLTIAMAVAKSEDKQEKSVLRELGEHFEQIINKYGLA